MRTLSHVFSCRPKHLVIGPEENTINADSARLSEAAGHGNPRSSFRNRAHVLIIYHPIPRPLVAFPHASRLWYREHTLVKSAKPNFRRDRVSRRKLGGFPGESWGDLLELRQGVFLIFIIITKKIYLPIFSVILVINVFGSYFAKMRPPLDRFFEHTPLVLHLYLTIYIIYTK